MTPHPVPLETPDRLLALGISKPVFDCRWPETRARVEALWASRPHALADEPYHGRQDGVEHTFLDAWLRYASEVVAFPKAGFEFRYATMGSTEAIRESLALHMIRSLHAQRAPVLHTLAGEYEGYAAEFEAYGGAVIRHARESACDSIWQAHPGDLVYLSAPSAIDGNLWPDYERFVDAAGLAGCTVAVDLTYVGLVADSYLIDVQHPAISLVVASLSKVFGVYYHRIGLAFSKEPLSGLYGNRWFKNIYSLHLGIDLVTRFGVRELPQRYRPVQQELCQQLAARSGVPFAPSQAILLANAPLSTLTRETWDLAILARGASGRALYPDTPAPQQTLRACLTPSFDAYFAAHGTP